MEANIPARKVANDIVVAVNSQYFTFNRLGVWKDGGRDVPLTVGQGVDERKPLFSLFVTQADRQWVGWNPIGRFESSGPKAETYIGWHFNTGEAEGPTRFALAEEYHKKYYQEGVLKDLIRVDQGEIKKLPPPPPPV